MPTGCSAESISYLLEQFSKRAQEKSKNYFEAKLPNELLKTAQILQFVNAHQETDTKKIVHTNSKNKTQETLKQFIDRYTEKEIKTNEKILPFIYDYLRKKGIKFTSIIMIQFYIKEIEKLGQQLSLADLKEFILKAKEILGKKDYFTLNHIEKEKQKALYQFANEFLTRLRAENEVKISDSKSDKTDIHKRKDKEEAKAEPPPKKIKLK